MSSQIMVDHEPEQPAFRLVIIVLSYDDAEAEHVGHGNM